MLIKELASRSSFAGARNTLNRIAQYEDFSSEQLDDFVQACTSNSQVYWIKDDTDIKEMISAIVDPNRERIAPWLLFQFDTTFKYKNIEV